MPNQKMGYIYIGQISQKALHVPFLLQKGLQFLRGVDGSFEVIWQTAKQGAIDPISMLNDYLNTVFDDVVTCSLCRCCRNTARLPRYPREKPQLAAILSLHVERLSFKKLIILFCRLPHEIETHLLGYLEGLWWSCFIIIFKVSGLCNRVCPLQQKHHPNHIGLWIIFQKGKDVNASYNVPYLSKIPRLLLWKILQHL